MGLTGGVAFSLWKVWYERHTVEPLSVVVVTREIEVDSVTDFTVDPATKTATEEVNMIYVAATRAIDRLQPNSRLQSFLDIC